MILRRKAIAALVAAGMMVLASPTTSAIADNGCYKFSDSEKAFAAKINKARSDDGKVALQLDPELSKVAFKHTKAMHKADKLFHTPSDVLSKRVTNWNVLGENVGVGGDVTSLHKAFMDSPGHKENILYSSFRHVGIGVKKRDGRMWVTVIFEAANNPGTILSMPDC